MTQIIPAYEYVLRKDIQIDVLRKMLVDISKSSVQMLVCIFLASADIHGIEKIF